MYSSSEIWISQLEVDPIDACCTRDVHRYRQRRRSLETEEVPRANHVFDVFIPDLPDRMYFFLFFSWLPSARIFSGPIVLYQDNKRAIIMAVQGGTFQQTKHLIRRQSYIREMIKAGDIMLKFKPAKEMKADNLTKPLPRSMLNQFKNRFVYS